MAIEVLNDKDKLDYAADMMRGVYLTLHALMEQGSEIENTQLDMLAEIVDAARLRVVSVSDDLKGGGVV